MANKRFGGRTLARSQALQVLFQAEATGRTVDEVLSSEYAITDGPLDPFGEMDARGAGEMLPVLDVIISQASTHWTVPRMPAVDRNILRLATYEMLEVDEVAVPITIDEFVELSKAYGTDESSRFVNGVLGRIADRIDAGEDVVGDATRERERLDEEERRRREEAERAAAERAAAEEAELAAAEAGAGDGPAEGAAERDDAPEAAEGAAEDGFEAYRPAPLDADEGALE